MKRVEYKCKVSIYREIAIQKPHGKHKTKIPTKKKKESKDIILNTVIKS